MKKILSALIPALLLSFFAQADTVTIKHFMVRENPFASDEVAVVATDTAGKIDEKVNGNFTFTFNGFDEALTFDKGSAFYRHKLDKSTFLYVKTTDTTGTRSMLYYIYKHDGKISTYHVSWIVLLLVPIILVLLAYVFKRFLIIAIILFCIFLYFNHHNGLSIPTFFESILDGLKSAFK